MHTFHKDNLFHLILNKELDELYISRAIMGIALALISIFIPIYLYQLGYSIPWIILFYVITPLYFFILTLFTPKVIEKFGIRHSILLSTPPIIIFYLGLQFLPTYPILFFILPFFMALSESLLWIAFDIYFLKFSKKEVRGKQLSLSYIIAIVTSVIGPILGAILITNFGYNLTYTIGAGLAFLSIFPLLFSKEFKRKINFSHKKLFKYLFRKKNLNTHLSFAGYAIESQVNYVLWPLFIFIILKGILDVGFIVSITSFFSVIVLLVVGRLTDLKSKVNLIKIGTLLNSLAWFFRIFVNTKFKIFFFDIFKKSSSNILLIPWVTYSYDIARKKNYFEYFVARQLIFKGTRVLVMPLIILIFYLLPIKTAFILTFIISGLATLLYPRIGKSV